MPKKPPPNGYYFFMLDFKRRAESRGRRFNGGMQEVATAASDDWKSLAQSEKDRYNKLAKERKNDPRPNVEKSDEKKFNSQGVSFAHIKREKAKADEKLKQENILISKFVNDMTLDDLHKKLIYLIHVNIFCKTDADVYYPAEIGIVKFSLKNGVKNVFHRFVDPGEIATGYSYAVKEHSERTHKLTLQFVRSIDGTSDLPKLYSDICRFLTEDESNGDDKTIPPLFTMYDDVFCNTNLNAVKKTLKHLWETVYASHDYDDDQWERFFKVLPLPDMFHRLKNHCMHGQNPHTIAFPNTSLPRLELQKDTYHYDSSTACKFHRDEDVIVHCSKSFVLRWAFIIRDHCTDLIGVDMFTENVCPKTKNEPYGDYEDDDTASLADSLHSCVISEASIDFSNAGARVKRDVAGSSGQSRIKLGEGADKCGFANRDSNSIDGRESAQSYASASHAQSRRGTGEYSSAGSAKREKDSDAYSSASSVRRVEADADPESEADQSIKSCPVAWPNVNRRPQSVPFLNENNFPSLGRGRGSLRNLRSRLNKTILE